MVYPDQQYGGDIDQFGEPMYGNEQAMATGMRASYGDIPMAAMAGLGNFGSTAYAGVNNMFSRLGGMAMPVSYTPPARVNTGYYGQYVQQTGFLRGVTGLFGLNDVPFGTPAYEYNIRSSSDLAERVAGGATAAAIMAGSIGAGYAVSGIGSAAGGFLGASLGPYGARIGAGIGAFAAPMLAYEAGQFLIDQMAERQKVQSFLEASSFRFVGAGSSMADPRFEAGMSRRARLDASAIVRNIDVKDSTLNAEDTSTILQESARLGLFTGTHDMKDFEKKFKDITENVKIVSKFLHTTLKEGLETIKHLKAIGIDTSEAGNIALQASALGKVAGRTGMEMLGLGLQGAEIFRGTGVDMGLGAQSNIMNLAQIRAARDAGFLSQQAIAQAGGEEALAQRQTASNLQFMQSSAGRGFNAAFYNGALGGSGFDAAAFGNILKNQNLTSADILAMSAGNMDSPGKVFGYSANQEKFLTDLGKSFGGKGLQLMRIRAVLAMAEMMSQASGGEISVKDAYRVVGKQMGLSDSELQADLADMKGANDFFRKDVQARNAQINSMRAENAYLNNPLYNLPAKAYDRMQEMAGVLLSPAHEFLSDVQEKFNTFYERRLGIERADMRIGTDVSPVVSIFDKANIQSRLDSQNYDLTVGYNDRSDLLEKAKRLNLISYEAKATKPGLPGRADLGHGMSISVSEYRGVEDQLRRFGVPRQRLEELKKDLDAPKLTSSEVLALGGVAAKADEIFSYVTGKSYKEATEQDIALVAKRIEGTPLEKIFEESLTVARTYNASGSVTTVQDINMLKEELQDVVGKINHSAEFGGIAKGSRLGYNAKLTSDEIIKLSMAQRMPANDPKRQELIDEVTLSVQKRTDGKGYFTAQGIGSPGGRLEKISAQDLVTGIMGMPLFTQNFEKIVENTAAQQEVQQRQGKEVLGDSRTEIVKGISEAIKDLGGDKSFWSTSKSQDALLKQMKDDQRFSGISEARMGRMALEISRHNNEKALSIGTEGIDEAYGQGGLTSSASGPGSTSDPALTNQIEDMRLQTQILQSVAGILSDMARRMGVQ